ncbi:hypothetical protein BDV24DRAFT_56500 [Aspergillus arachidicola]|uniref:Uncharacterized protein n=1 Tax=Aspergillus arachidicola TaxID=656916 RepID=A0A5N6Y711_9EURO|nr:hypothetical protein BDV24DRAFT_56500 [Aspergillus arachidicola]
MEYTYNTVFFVETFINNLLFYLQVWYISFRSQVCMRYRPITKRHWNKNKKNKTRRSGGYTMELIKK